MGIPRSRPLLVMGVRYGCRPLKKTWHHHHLLNNQHGDMSTITVQYTLNVEIFDAVHISALFAFLKCLRKYYNVKITFIM